jgi:hypothetical protein
MGCTNRRFLPTVRRAGAVLALLVALGSLTVPGAVATRGPTVTPVACSTEWAIVPSGNQGRNTNNLSRVSMVSADDAWAVGTYVAGSITQPLTEHWDGVAFSVVPSAPVAGRSALNGVSAVASNDAWAVGFIGTSVLIEHWDGSAWTRSSSHVQGVLQGVDAVSANDVWAVGWYGESAISLHWDGDRWSRIPVDVNADEPQLFDVQPFATDDVWAVGSYLNRGAQTSLIVHWDGVRWSRVINPNPPTASSVFLRSVDGPSSGDVWAAGWYIDPSTGQKALIEHWDGVAWAIRSIPEPSLYPMFRGVAAAPGAGAWAVGSMLPDGGADTQTLSERWDGTTWSVVASANLPDRPNFLQDVDVLPDGSALAVGTYSAPHDPHLRTLAQEICLPSA